VLILEGMWCQVLVAQVYYPTIWEAEIGRIVVQDQTGDIVHEILSSK
jgi:hypothetical protein